MGLNIITTCQYCGEQIKHDRGNSWQDLSSYPSLYCQKEELGMIMHQPHIWYAKDGGKVVLDNASGNYIFITAPGGSPRFDVGEVMPKEWHIT